MPSKRSYVCDARMSGAILPVPGNAELAVWLLAEIVLAIVAGVSSRVDAHDWAIATTWLTAAYIISRGIAKASALAQPAGFVERWRIKRAHYWFQRRDIDLLAHVCSSSGP